MIIHVFLDFDGVLFDTLKEAYIICRKAYSNIDYNRPIEKNEYKKFYRYKFLVYNSWQYAYIMKLLTEHVSGAEFIKRYQLELANRNYSFEQEFDIKYYSARADLINNYYEFWNELEKPFPFFYRIKESYKNNLIEPIIVSKKNKVAILHRFKQYEFNLDNSKIFGKNELDGYDTKADFINEYISKNHFEQSYFVDDNSNNLVSCNKFKNIISLLAGWGNTAIDETGLSCDEICSKIGI